MSLAFAIYLIERLDVISDVFMSVAFAGSALCVAGILLAPIIREAINDFGICDAGYWIKRGIAAWLVIVALALITPSGKTVAAMYLVPKIVNNEQLTEIAGNSMEALRLLTKDWLNNLAKENK